MYLHPHMSMKISNKSKLKVINVHTQTNIIECSKKYWNRTKNLTSGSKSWMTSKKSKRNLILKKVILLHKAKYFYIILLLYKMHLINYWQKIHKFYRTFEKKSLITLCITNCWSLETYVKLYSYHSLSSKCLWKNIG